MPQRETTSHLSSSPYCFQSFALDLHPLKSLKYLWMMIKRKQFDYKFLLELLHIEKQQIKGG